MAHVSRVADHEMLTVLPFRAEMYGARSVYNDPDYLRWLYQEAPDASPPRLWLYRDGGEIRAHQGALPVSIKVGSQIIAAQWSLDVMIHPTHRRRGIGTAMQRVVEEASQLTMGFEVSGAAQAACRKAGWRDVGEAPFYVHPLDPGALLAHRGLPAALARPLGALWRRLRPGSGDNATTLRIEVATAPDASFDALWRDVSPTLPVAVRRDARFLAWRFHRFPRADRYTCLRVLRGDTALGYLVLRLGDKHGLRVGYLVDYLCAPALVGDLLRCGLAALRERGASVAYMVHLSPYFGPRDMLRLGFVPRPSRWRLLVCDHKLTPAQQRLVRDPAQWFFTLADSDADRPREGVAYA
jgi:GNAT superfamily N-acetyltransferase